MTWFLTFIVTFKKTFNQNINTVKEKNVKNMTDKITHIITDSSGFIGYDAASI